MGAARAKKRYTDLGHSHKVLIQVALYFEQETQSSIYYNQVHKLDFRSSRPEVICKTGVLKHFAKFTGKQLYQILYFNKLAGLRPIFIEHLWWLLLEIIYLFIIYFLVIVESNRILACTQRNLALYK